MPYASIAAAALLCIQPIWLTTCGRAEHCITVYMHLMLLQCTSTWGCYLVLGVTPLTGDVM
jgi:hypothetical protein